MLFVVLSTAQLAGLGSQTPHIQQARRWPSNRSFWETCKTHLRTNVRTIFLAFHPARACRLWNVQKSENMVFIFTFIGGLIRDVCVFTNRLFMATDVELPPCSLSLAHRLGLPQPHFHKASFPACLTNHYYRFLFLKFVHVYVHKHLFRKMIHVNKCLKWPFMTVAFGLFICGLLL